MREKQTLQKICYASKRYLNHNSSTILSCMGAIGVVSTSVMAVRVTPKAIRLLEKSEIEKGETLTKVEVMRVVAPLYIPVIISCIATISCIIGANVINKRNQASLASAYALLDQSYQRYRKAANYVYGDDADSKIKIQAAKDMYVSADGYYMYAPDIDRESEKILFYDEYSQRYFTSTMASVLNAQYHLNRNLVLRGEVVINEFYEFLGIDEIDCGFDIGWSMDKMIEIGYMWLDFENCHVKMEDGMECYIVSTPYGPEVLSYEDDE